MSLAAGNWVKVSPMCRSASGSQTIYPVRMALLPRLPWVLVPPLDQCFAWSPGRSNGRRIESVGNH